MKIVSFLKKHVPALVLILILLIGATALFFYINEKEKQDYIEIFRRNKSIFEEISTELMPLEYGTTVSKEAGKIVVKQNGNITEIFQYPIDEETKTNIRRAINDFGVKSINKTDECLKFIYSSKRDFHALVYTADKSKLTGFTDVEHLEGNWYYCYILYE
ncbi:hypothetical protein EPD62_013335 [Acetivibrio thermocellus]|uniref:hypothetical protein n=1 Tax=Acetivibrio thermocellus TaxID=1515 RepID=UPI001F18F140|nr:hypothetical protein [Acetivibrio thermocellus]